MQQKPQAVHIRRDGYCMGLQGRPSMESVLSTLTRPDYSFRNFQLAAPEQFQPLFQVFLNVLTTTHSKENTQYSQKHQETVLLWICSFCSSRPQSTILQLMHMDWIHRRLLCSLPKGGFGQWEAPARDEDGRRGVGLGIFFTGSLSPACCGMPACLLGRSRLLSGSPRLMVFWKLSFSLPLQASEW